MNRITTALALALLSASASADPLPASRRIDWAYAGVPGGIPNRTTICATFNPGATAAAINSAVQACNNGVVLLNAGTYTSASLNGTIQVYKSNVTLRGAGADRTTLTGLQVITLGNGYNVSLGTAITGGATKGSTTFTVASAANLSVGTMIEIDRSDDTTLVVNTGNQGGGARNMTQVNMVTAVSGNTITVRNPLIYDFGAGSPAVKYYYAGITKNSGIESLKVDHAGFSGGYNFVVQYCDSCWLKGLDSTFASGYHFVVLGTLNVEIRDSYIHDGGSGPNNSGANFYGNYLYGTNSSAKIENNIFNKDSPPIELNNSTSGLYIGYNYSYGSPSQYGTNLVTWTFDDGHAPFNMMNLYEGNIGEMWGADNYFGGTGYGTALRNYFTGFNPNYGVAGEAVWLDRLAYNYNLVGNVLGSANQKPTAYTGCDTQAIYRLGYANPGNCSTTPWDGFTPTGGYPDAKVTATLLRWGNYDYFNKSTRFVASEIPSGVAVPSDQIIPNSYYYSAKPSWWPSGTAWPPIGPDVTGGNGDVSGHVNKIPAQLCWDSRNLSTNGSFNAAACYDGGTVQPPPTDTTAPSVPAGLTATAVSSSQINLSWTASTDAVGVTGYAIMRNGTQVGTSQSASFNDAGLMPSTQYSYAIKAFDMANNVSAVSPSVNATTQAGPAATGNYTIFTNQTPATLGQTDGPNINYELGTKFTTSAAGKITGIRFFKDAKETGTGTRTGRIWSVPPTGPGMQLATAAFSNETASGWQQADLATPVDVAANTTYLVTVNTRNAYYVSTVNGLMPAITNGPLSTAVGNNGVFGNPGAYPANTFMASNYFRDVAFSAAGPVSPPPDAATVDVTIVGKGPVNITVNGKPLQ